MKHICPKTGKDCTSRCMWWDEGMEQCMVETLTRELVEHNQHLTNIEEYGLATKEV